MTKIQYAYVYVKVQKNLESRPQTVLVVRPFACVALTFQVANRVYKDAVTNSTPI